MAYENTKVGGGRDLADDSFTIFAEGVQNRFRLRSPLVLELWTNSYLQRRLTSYLGNPYFASMLLLQQETWCQDLPKPGHNNNITTNHHGQEAARPHSNNPNMCLTALGIS